MGQASSHVEQVQHTVAAGRRDGQALPATHISNRSHPHKVDNDVNIRVRVRRVRYRVRHRVRIGLGIRIRALGCLEMRRKRVKD